VRTVESALARHSSDPGQLTLELTETTIAAAADEVVGSTSFGSGPS